MRKTILIAILFALVGGASIHMTVNAAADRGLQVRPLLYKSQLASGEKKRGIIDIANPTNENFDATMSVQAFRQIDDNGGLQFYDDKNISAAITPDITDIQLNGKEAARIGFTIDGAKLPQGDIFATIFATATAKPTPGSITPSVKVGTILVIENGKPSEHKATVSTTNIPFFQLGDSIKGSATVRNLANSSSSTGFFPEIKTKISPWGESTKFDAPLVSAGRSRSFDYSIPSSQFGFYRVTISANQGSSSSYIFAVTGKWRILAPLVLVILVLLIIAFFVFRRIFRHQS